MKIGDTILGKNDGMIEKIIEFDILRLKVFIVPLISQLDSFRKITKGMRAVGEVQITSLALNHKFPDIRKTDTWNPYFSNQPPTS